MGRVEIAGQFNVDMALCSKSPGPFRIERHPSSIPTTSIHSWNGFCDSVDQALAPLAKIKAIARISAFLLYVVLALFVFGVQILPRMMGDFDYGLLKYSGFVVFPIFAIYALVWLFYIRGGLKAGMEKVKGVCEQYSTMNGGVKYTLESEHWGGCNKPHVMRWYIIVDVDEEANAANVADTTGATTSDYFSTQDTSPGYFSTSTQQETNLPTTDATPSNTLADMLK